MAAPMMPERPYIQDRGSVYIRRSTLCIGLYIRIRACISAYKENVQQREVVLEFYGCVIKSTGHTQELHYIYIYALLYICI